MESGQESNRQRSSPVSGVDLGGLLNSVAEQAMGVARWIPGVRFAERQARRVERLMLVQLSVRLQEIEAARPMVESVASGMPAAVSGAFGEAPVTPVAMLERLLRRSMDQTPAESFMTFVDMLLHAIVPDEARILSALSDGSRYPVVHVDSGGIGRPTRRLLSNASSVGRAAGVALPNRTPDYLTHMLQLGLVEIGPEHDSIPYDEYEILLTDSTVRHARTLGDRGGPLVTTRIAKRSVRISDLGMELWRACRPNGGNGSDGGE